MLANPLRRRGGRAFGAMHRNLFAARPGWVAEKNTARDDLLNLFFTIADRGNGFIGCHA